MPSDTAPKDVMTPREAAAFLSVSVDTLRRWTNAKRVPHIRTLGNQRRYRRADLEALAEERYHPAEETA